MKNLKFTYTISGEIIGVPEIMDVQDKRNSIDLKSLMIITQDFVEIASFNETCGLNKYKNVCWV